jgi:hypothetical protein
VFFTPLLNLAVSCFMLGVIWLIQVVSYPLFSYVNTNGFKKYHSARMEKITPLLSIVMLPEALVALRLLLYNPRKSGFLLAINLCLLGFIWILSLAFPVNRIPCTKK